MEESKTLQVFRSSAGLGLRTAVGLQKGDSVVEYVGKRVPNTNEDTSVNRYLFEVDDATLIDGSGRDNIARYINHSCNPNCEAVLYEDEGKIYIEARRAIPAQEELTIDYGTEYFDTYIKPHGCRCQHCQTAA
jgi:hypothetical protein